MDHISHSPYRLEYSNGTHYSLKKRPLASLSILTLLLAGTLSAASVKDFGAVGNGSSDDTNAIQAAIDSTPANGTLQFPAGNYLVTRTLVFRSNRTYQGQPGAIIHTNTQDFAGVTDYNATSNLTIDSLTFDGGGLNVDGSSVAGTNVHITHCTFQNIVNGSGNWAAHDGLFVGPGLTGGSTIAYNRFTNITGPGNMEDDENDYEANGIHLYNTGNTSVTDNTFDSVYQGISVHFTTSGPFPGLVIARNTFNQIHRMGIEMQGGGTQGLLIDSNHIENFHNPWYNSFGLSIVVDGGTGTRITNNYLSATPAAYTQTSQGKRFGIGIEIGGNNTVVTSNTVANPWFGSLVVGAAPYVSVQNNMVCNGGSGQNVSFEAGTQPGAVTSPNTMMATCPSSPSADTAPPTVALTAPTNGSVVSGTATVSANASDNVGVTGVTFVLDGSQQLASDASAPYSVQWNTTTVANGSHTLTAIAVDAAGNKATSAAATVTVNNTTPAPTPSPTPNPVPPSGSIPTAGLSLWLRADKGVTLNGTTVSRWADQSGHGTDATQPVASAQPAFIGSDFKGKPALRFDGKSDFLGFNLPINGLTGMTIILVGNNRSNQNGGDVQANNSAVHWGETAWWGVTYLSPFQTNVVYRFGTTQVGNLPQYNRPTSIGTNFTLTTAIKNGTTDTLYVNGQKVMSSGGKLNTLAASTNSATIGRGDGTTYFSGDISEVIVYNRALTDAERQAVEANVAARNLQ